MGVVEVIDKKKERAVSYYLDERIKKGIDKEIIPSLREKDKDYIIVIDGKEGVGKSWFGLQVGRYIDPNLNLSRVVFNPEEFKEAIFKAKKGEVIIYDEAFTGLSSRASLSGVNRYLVSMMMQMRQKNLCVILILPTFFLLDRYAAMFRSRILIHVYENSGRRGYFRIYNDKKKKQLWFAGKKDYVYRVRTKFKGRFYGVFALGDSEMEKKYREKKSKALEDTEKNPMSAGQVKYREQRDLVIYLIRKITGLPYDKLSNLLSDYDLDMSYVQIRNICIKFGDKGRQDIEETKEKLLELIKTLEDKGKIEEKIDKKDKIELETKENELDEDETDDFELKSEEFNDSDENFKADDDFLG